MRLATCAALLLAGVSTAAAQSPSSSQLVLTILGGAVGGHRLWDVSKQPLASLVRVDSGQFDTLRLSREITSSIVVGASATYFVSSKVGIHAEISYLGLPNDDGCTLLHRTPNDSLVPAVCNDIQSHSGSGGAISLFLGATVRAAAQRGLSPYLRASIGLVGMPHSKVAVVGSYLTSLGPVPVGAIDDPNPRNAAPLLGLAAGVTTPVSKAGAYQFRLELRDVITSIERVTGPADAGTRIAPTASRFYHHFALTIGLDVVLEKKRGRRY
ncbi:MAG: hypothetical protein ACREMI_04415 [Gemmatimonadales bacterium]